MLSGRHTYNPNITVLLIIKHMFTFYYLFIYLMPKYLHYCFQQTNSTLIVMQYLKPKMYNIAFILTLTYKDALYNIKNL